MFVYLFLLIVSQFLSFISVRSKQFTNILDAKEKYDILDSTILDVKNYILEKVA